MFSQCHFIIWLVIVLKHFQSLRYLNYYIYIYIYIYKYIYNAISFDWLLFKNIFLLIYIYIYIYLECFVNAISSFDLLLFKNYFEIKNISTTIYLHIYIYMYMGSISSLIYIWLNIVDIFFVCIFFVNPFKLPYRFYDIWLELVDKSSIMRMAQVWAESISEITNYGRFINQFPPDIIRSIR